ncbi:hypothetical protein EXIGLDRAFT_840245 [Exidia glandulosa HHB12029]|uniref:Aminoglycoside phosphotransferase domain-containing protein n=1 Tax=Exidia glandulosa HHB12029 TaxID=1314781 RepID=A0A165EK90_EXIGL|nr:hypothetical protein EXIGLDRAFT_840245 [Exidia glandulosa HHB12029]
MFGYMFKEENQRAMHKLEFDVDALASAAHSSTRVECVEIQKLSEGPYGRSFLLTMEGGSELVARFPFPCAGRRTRLVQSEVATLDFLGNHFGLPVPRIVTYNSSTNPSVNVVGAPYIIQTRFTESEKQHSGEMLTPAALLAAKPGRFLDDVVEIQATLASIPFAQHGSLYYVADVDESLRDRPLFQDVEGFQPADETRERFRIGPSVSRNFYRGDRAMLELDRGPWENDEAYFQATVDAEIKWLEYFGSFEEARRTAWEPERSPEEHIELLKRWRSLAPKLMLPRNTPRLWHPAFTAQNLRTFKEKDELVLEGVVGWEGAVIAPLPLQATFPDFVDPRLWGKDDGEGPRLSGVGTEDKEEEDAAQTLVELYAEKMAKVAPLVVYVQSSDMLFVLREAALDASRTWEVGSFCLHYCLYRLAQEWSTYEATDREAILGHKNVHVLPEELTDLPDPSTESAHLWQTFVALDARLHVDLAKEGVIGKNEHGHVLAHEVEDAKRIAGRLREDCLEAASDEDEKRRLRRVWPVSEERWTSCTESCE